MARVTKAELEQRVEELEQELEELKKENELLKKKCSHNVRGAGRKPNPDKQKMKRKIKRYTERGMSDIEIIEKIGITRATYYRYKKELAKKESE